MNRRALTHSLRLIAGTALIAAVLAVPRSAQAHRSDTAGLARTEAGTPSAGHGQSAGPQRFSEGEIDRLGEQFAGAVETGSPEMIEAFLRSLGQINGDLHEVRPTIEAVAKIVNSGDRLFHEVLQDTKLGSRFRRIVVMVARTNHEIYLTSFFRRTDAGWEACYFAFNDDLNKALNQPYCAYQNR